MERYFQLGDQADHVDQVCKVILAGAEYVKAKMDAAVNWYTKYKHLSRSIANTERRMVNRVLTPKEATENTRELKAAEEKLSEDATNFYNMKAISEEEISALTYVMLTTRPT